MSNNKLGNIIPIFSTILYPAKFKVSNQQTNELMYIAKHTDWSIQDEVDNVRSKSLHVIKENKELHWLGQSIFESFNTFKNEVLRFEETEFVMTTSWMTYTPPGLGSTFHNHNNSMWSGVFYFGNEESKNTGIRFGDFQNKMNGFTLDPTEFNVWNCSSYDWYPTNNSVVFFPSQTPHTVLPNKGKQTRYSIAFNLMPIGFVGRGDSSVNYERHNNYLEKGDSNSVDREQYVGDYLGQGDK